MDYTIIALIIGVGFGIFIAYSKLRLTQQKQGRMRDPDRPFPQQWRDLLQENVPFYTRLSSQQKQKFEKRVHIFLLNVQIVGVNTEVTHLDRILVASGAIIPIFGFDSWHYANLNKVEIYPDKFNIPTTNQFANGLVGYGAMEGKMWISRKAMIEGFRNPENERNVAIHEFVHILDKQDGKINGVVSTIMQENDISPWLQIVRTKMQEITLDKSTIREYAVTNEGEFLAVVSEFFFEHPEKMKSEHPELYRALDKFYNPKSNTTFPFRNGYSKAPQGRYSR